jgi:hypothetical protein
VLFCVDAAGQIDGQHECAVFPLTIHQRTGSRPAFSIICRYLPPYSPDLNPIEKLWSKVKGSFAQIQSKDAGCSSKCDSDIPGIGKVYSAGIIRENPDLLNEYRRGFFPCWEVFSAAFCQALTIEN